MNTNFPEYSSSELETIGEKFCTWLNASVPSDIDIEKIITCKLGIDVFPIPGLKRNCGVLAYINTKNNTIYIDSYVYDNFEETLNTTLAEEIAHVILHKDCLPHTINEEEYLCRWNGIPDNIHHRMERNAKYLAAAILMPKKMFKKRFKELIKDAEHIYDTILQRQKYVLAELKKEFRVSDWSITYRCNDLKLIPKNSGPPF
jgi:Zn-dependent peptidase ImmA (M78 family)